MAMECDDKESYSDVSYILGLKVVPGKENNVRSIADTRPEVFKSFKSLGQFDAIVLIKSSADAKALVRELKDVDSVQGVFLIDLE